MQPKIIGHSLSKLPILSYEFGQEHKPKLLFLGGVHGDEIEGVYACRYLLSRFLNQYDLKVNLLMIPEVNPDGVLNMRRQNNNQVDLNRNLPTKDWTNDIPEKKYYPGSAPASEPENKALISVIDSFEPDFIISMHSWKPMLNVNGDCGKLVEVIAEKTGYSIEPTVGYPTPGSLGTYTGIENNIPTLTYELEREMKLELINELHIDPIIEGIRTLEE